MNLLLTQLKKTVSSIAMLGLILGGLGFAATPAARAEHNVTVTITKYIDGERATSENADGLSFPMTSTWNATNIGAGTGTYELSPSSYEAETTEMSHGADYTTNEVVGGDSVGALCEDGKPFALLGYTSGDSMSEAEAATPTMTPPAFTGMETDKYVIVWNEDCTPPVEPETVGVTISKYIDGEPATAESADGASFPMTATWNDPEGIGAGTGTYTLDGSSSPAYETETVVFSEGADYSTNEVVGGDVVGASCTTEQPYALQGYTTGTTREEAESATPSMTLPAFTNLSGHEYVIVWNISCDEEDPDGEIGGDVVGEGELAVTSVEAIDTTGTANGTYESGWSYIFHVTLPSDETDLAMKFSNWTSGSSTIPAAGNMRISSAQADNGGAYIPVVTENTYTTPDLHMTTDLNPAMAGVQVEVRVDVRIPVGTESASYTTTYGVRSQ